VAGELFLRRDFGGGLLAFIVIFAAFPLLYFIRLLSHAFCFAGIRAHVKLAP
jgi:hypothetical protein